MHKTLLLIIIGLIVLGALLSITQLWVPVLSWGIFIKAIITIAIVVVVLGLLMVLKTDLGEHKSLKDDNYLD
jgi:hydrogenase/urease accessory protein HupE